MKKQKTVKAPLSPAAINWAANLKRLWLAKKRKLGLTQETAGAKLGWTQGAVGQYINAHIPLNTDAKIKFARLLDVDVSEIDPSLDSVAKTNAAVSGMLDTVVKIPHLRWEDAPSGGLQSARDAAIKWHVAIDTGARTFALTVPGDSMNGDDFPIRAGTTIFVDPDVRPRDFTGAKAIILVQLPDGDVVLRQLTKDGAKFYLRATAPGFPLLPLTDDCRILGAVVKISFELQP